MWMRNHELITEALLKGSYKTKSRSNAHAKNKIAKKKLYQNAENLHFQRELKAKRKAQGSKKRRIKQLNFNVQLIGAKQRKIP
jgi:hypothetical protein